MKQKQTKNEINRLRQGDIDSLTNKERDILTNQNTKKETEFLRRYKPERHWSLDSANTQRFRKLKQGYNRGFKEGSISKQKDVLRIIEEMPTYEHNLIRKDLLKKRIEEKWKI